LLRALGEDPDGLGGFGESSGLPGRTNNPGGRTAAEEAELQALKKKASGG